MAKQNMELAVVNGCSQELAGSDYAASLVPSVPGPDSDRRHGLDKATEALSRAAFLNTASLTPLPRWWLHGLFLYNFWMPLYSSCIGDLQVCHGTLLMSLALSVLVKTIFGNRSLLPGIESVGCTTSSPG